MFISGISISHMKQNETGVKRDIFSERYRRDHLTWTKNTRWFLPKLTKCPNYQYNDFNIGLSGVRLCPENLFELGGLSELSVPELTSLYCSLTMRHSAVYQFLYKYKTLWICQAYSKWVNDVSAKYLGVKMKENNTYIKAIITGSSLSTHFLFYFDIQWFLHGGDCTATSAAPACGTLLGLRYSCVARIWFSGTSILQIYWWWAVTFFLFNLSLWKWKLKWSSCYFIPRFQASYLTLE